MCSPVCVTDTSSPAFANFAQVTLVAITSTLSTSSQTDDDPTPSCLALLNLMAYRIGQSRKVANEKKADSVPFEVFVACHLAFRHALSTRGKFDAST